jgi:hypothetical protein
MYLEILQIIHEALKNENIRTCLQAFHFLKYLVSVTFLMIAMSEYVPGKIGPFFHFFKLGILMYFNTLKFKTIFNPQKKEPNMNNEFQKN